jgi:hypothetical protein
MAGDFMASGVGDKAGWKQQQETNQSQFDPMVSKREASGRKTSF